MVTRLARGLRVAGRYRLENEIGQGADSITWRAIDERLDRPVALRIFAPVLDRKTIVRRAGIAASLTHPRVVRVFDTGEDAGRFFTVSELMPESLRNVRLPLSSDVALQTATDIAEALHYAHGRGVAHGSLQEANVLLSEGGTKVGDFAMSDESASKEGDLAQFGALLVRVCRTPDPSAPPGFTRIIEGLASGAYESAGEVLTDLRSLRPKPLEARPAPRMRGWLVIIVALLLGIAAFGAMRLGEQSPSQRLLPKGAIKGTPLSVIGIKDFDPFGSAPKRESPGTVRNAIDGDSETFWSTERYSSSADFSGLKPGVGLILDVGRSREVGQAQVLFAAPGCSFELRYSGDKNASVDRWTKAAEIASSPLSAPIQFGAEQARYWLLWITRLTTHTPGAGEKFACAVKEADLYAPP